MHRARVVFDDEHSESGVLHLRPGVNLLTGEQYLSQAFQALTSLESDLLVLASAVFACDLAFKRGEREDITRSIELSIPVVNHSVLTGAVGELEYILYRLSHDAWKIHFEVRAGRQEDLSTWPADDEGKVLLFSGGLDSLAAAIEFSEAGTPLQLVSHITANHAVSGSQEALFKYMEALFPQQASRLAVRVGGASKPTRGYSFPTDKEREETQRTRSFMFLVLACITARRRGFRDVVLIAENGQMAIHLPLSAGRISAFSTHTAHPDFVATMGAVMSRVLRHPIRIENPYLYRTKGEVVGRTVAAHSPTLEHAVSCWKASRVSGGKKHCGFCVPCLVRRVAIESHGVVLDEYNRDLFKEDLSAAGPEDDGKRNLVEFGEFVTLFEGGVSQAELEDLFPELINPYIDSFQAVAMYRRFSHEARAVLERYPAIRHLLR